MPPPRRFEPCWNSCRANRAGWWARSASGICGSTLQIRFWFARSGRACPRVSTCMRHRRPLRMNSRFSFGLKTLAVAGLALLAIGTAVGYAVNKFGKPKSVIHVVTLYYKDGTTDEQRKAVLAAVEKMAGELPGIKNVWLKSTKVQGAYME